MKRLAIIGIPILLLCVVTLVGAAKVGILPQGTPFDFLSPASSFVRSWESRITSSDNPDTIESFVSKNKEGGWVVRTHDGGWVSIVMEHDCCTGAGFNATLYVTSGGDSFLDMKTCYCGSRPLAEEISRYSRASPKAFLADVRVGGKQLKSRGRTRG